MPGRHLVTRMAAVLFASTWGGSLGICTAWHGRTNLHQLFKGSCSLHVSSHNSPADCQRRTLALPLNSSANAAPASVQVVLTLMFAVVALNNRNRVFDIRSLTWDEWSYPQLLLLWGLYDPRIAEPSFEQKENESLDVRASLGVNPLNMPRTAYLASEVKHSQQPTMPLYHLTLTYHLCIVHVINGLHYFIVLQCHLDDH